MTISDEDLVRQLESVPQVEPPDMRGAVMNSVRGGFSRQSHRLKPARTRVLAGLAWAAAIVIVIGLAIERKNLPWQQTAATIAPLPVQQWPVIARVAVAEEGRLTVRRNGDQFAVQAFLVSGGPISVAWDQKKLSMAHVVPDSKGPEVVILQRRPGASGSAIIRLSVAGRELLKTSISVE